MSTDDILAQSASAAHYSFKPYQDDFFVSDMKASNLPSKTYQVESYGPFIDALRAVMNVSAIVVILAFSAIFNNKGC